MREIDKKLIGAIKKGDTTSVLEYLEQGANANAIQNGKTALYYAVVHGNDNIVEALIRAGAKVDKNSYNQDTMAPILYWAAVHGKEDIVKDLVDAGADVNRKNDIGRTPLFMAAICGHAKVLEILINAKAVVNIRDINDDTPLIRSASSKKESRTRCSQILIEAGANINATDKHGIQPLHLAARKGDIEIIRILIDKGANIEAKTSWSQYTALHLASTNGHLEAVKLLIAKGANIHEIDSVGMTAIHYAVECGHNDVLQYLLNEKQSKAIINMANKKGEAPLHIAILKGNTEALRLLIDAGANVNQKLGNETALYLAIRKQPFNLELLQVLIDAKANVNAKSFYRTPLHHAAEKGYADILRELVYSGANLEEKDQFGQTALHLASSKGNIAIISILTENGANVNAKDNSGKTPAHWAARENHYDAIVHLTNCGFDPYLAKDKNGQTVFDIVDDPGKLQLMIKTTENKQAAIKKIKSPTMNNNHVTTNASKRLKTI